MRPRRPRRAPALLALIIVLALGTVTTSPFADAALSPPPATPVPPDGSLSPFPSVLQTPADAVAVPAVSAPVAVLADLDSGQMLLSRGADTPRPIASVTKIMTALLVLERTHPDDIVVVSPDAVFEEADYGASSTIGLRAGEHLTVRQILRGMLLASANDAAVALAVDVAGSTSAFVRLMNERAKQLGMRHTVFYSPNGLDDRGHASGRDLVTLTRIAFRAPGFAAAVGSKTTVMSGPAGERHLQNRNVLLWLYRGATGVKTGWTAAARYCLVATAERDGRRLVAVVLGAPADAFSDAASLLNYGFAAFASHTFVRKGAAVGTLPILGGSVPVVAGAGIRRLVPARALAGARLSLTADPDAAFPPAPGQRVGTLRVSVPGATVGTVPLLAGAFPAPRPGRRALVGAACGRDRPGRRRRHPGSPALSADRVRRFGTGRLLGSPAMSEVASVLFGREAIGRRVRELGRTIAGDYVGREPVLITVLRGGAMFLADLMRALDRPVETHLIAISRYGGAEESMGRVQILLDVDADLTGRDVLWSRTSWTPASRCATCCRRWAPGARRRWRS